MSKIKINHILQPEGSNLCGQTCIAMIAHISLERAIKAVGKRGLTRTKDLIMGLNNLGFKCGKKLIRTHWYTCYPSLCIAKVVLENGRLHWIVICNREGYDPARKSFFLTHKERITSYLPIYRRIK